MVLDAGFPLDQIVSQQTLYIYSLLVKVKVKKGVE